MRPILNILDKGDSSVTGTLALFGWGKGKEE